VHEAALHVRVASKTSVGQFALLPVQTSGLSQVPADARQVVPELPGTFLQPVAVSHVSTVHTLLSSQFGGVPPTQLPLTHTSTVVQAFASSQPRVLFAWTHPVAGLHESSVQTFESLQF
jgi:hypothetical protein